MTGAVLGLAILFSSLEVAPTMRTSPATLASAVFAFEPPAASVPSTNLRQPLGSAELRSPWQRGSLQSSHSRTSRFTKTDKVIAIAAGIAGGWIAGGYIGGAITNNYDNPDDDTSVLRGIMIGAPIGAVLGAIIGHRLTR